MPGLFPSGEIDVFQAIPQRGSQHLRLSRAQVACLVSHQFLCTFSPPAWRDGFYDFSIWYNSSQRHPQAVETYLTALFTYFDEDESSDDDDDNGVEYSLHTNMLPDAAVELAQVPLVDVDILTLSRYSTEQQELGYQGPDGAVVVSANKNIGFGQSATQEELYMGNCPEACPAVLFTPTLLATQVLIIKGARPMLRITGQRRDLEWSILPRFLRKGGRMLFMDALEIDELDEGDGQLPDTKPQHIARELQKAYNAFSAWLPGQDATVWTGLWGSGAFNGDPAIKMCLLWMAASMANKRLRVICDESYEDFCLCFSQLTQQLRGGSTAGDLRHRLSQIPKGTARLSTISFLLDARC